MRLQKILLLTFIPLLFSTCKKEKEERVQPSYPSTIVFENDVEVIVTSGFTSISFIEQKFVIHCSEYSSSKDIWTTNHYALDLSESNNEGAIKSEKLIVSKEKKIPYGSGIVSEMSTSDYACFLGFKRNGFEATEYSFYKYDQNGNEISSIKDLSFNNVLINKAVSVNDGYILVGSQVLNGSQNVFVIKLDMSFTTIIWEKSFSLSRKDKGVDAVQLCDGSYGIIGHTLSANLAESDIWYLKIDANGSLKSDYTYEVAGNEVPEQMVLGTDCDIYIAGYSYSIGISDYDGYFLRINEKGDKIWEKTFGSSLQDEFNVLTQVPNTKTFIAVGSSLQGIGKPKDIFVVCFDENGKILWLKKYGDTGLTELPKDIVADNEFYYLACNREGGGGGNHSTVFIKDRIGN